MKKVYKITHCSTLVHEDSYKDGEGKLVNNWDIKKICPTLCFCQFNSLKELFMQVNNNYLNDDKDKLKDFWYIFEDPDLEEKKEIRFDCDQQLDVLNCVASDDKIEKWKDEKETLYAAHTVMYVKAIYIEETDYQEMYQDAKALNLDDI